MSAGKVVGLDAVKENLIEGGAKGEGEGDQLIDGGGSGTALDQSDRGAMETQGGRDLALGEAMVDTVTTKVPAYDSSVFRGLVHGSIIIPEWERVSRGQTSSAPGRFEARQRIRVRR